jgi:hypothetical protein
MLNTVDTILKATIVIIKIKIVSVWSWKKISCSRRGDAAFWNPKEAHVGISKRIIYSFMKLKFIALICHFRS